MESPLMKRFLFTLFLCGFAIPHTFAHPIGAGNCITTVVADRILTEQVEHCDPGCAEPGLHGHKYVPLRQPAGGGYGVHTGYIDSDFGEGHSEWNRYTAQFHDCSETDAIWQRLTKQPSNRSTRQATHTGATPGGTSPPQSDTNTHVDSSDTRNLALRTPAPLTLTYLHVFPAGVSTQHIPLDIIDFNKSGVAVNSVPGVFDQLGDSVASLIASRGVSGWTYVTYPNFPAHNAIWKSIGFIAVMDEEVTVQIEGTFGGWTGEYPRAYHILHLREGGLTLLGVPLRSTSLETVSDFYTFFGNVESVVGIDPDLEIDTTETPIRVQDDWFVELDKDMVIDGYTSYLIRSDGAAQRTLWGVPWAYEPPSAAPPAEQWAYYKKMAMTWGAIKAGDLYHAR